MEDVIVRLDTGDQLPPVTAGTWRVAVIDPALGAGIRRFLPRRFRRDEHEHAALVPWSQTEAFTVMPRSARSR
ncbi:MAG TPA: hypothetical protein VGI55_11680, partial [Solirubrobacteraceae bacterium]